jgi:hypothetical protein
MAKRPSTNVETVSQLVVSLGAEVKSTLSVCIQDNSVSPLIRSFAGM